ncbi:hypothetical protein OKW39_006589 [Paraburkholderia sp. MM6662-R1]
MAAIGSQSTPERIAHQTPLRFETRRFVEPVREDHAGIGRVAIDPIARNSLAHQLDRVGGQRIEFARASRPERLQQVGAIEAVAAEHEAAVASRCAEADLLLLEHDDVFDAAFGESQRGGESRKSAADDADVRAASAVERRVGRGAGDGGFVETLHGARACGHALG